MTIGSLIASIRSARIGRALRHRNYRLFFAGQGISLIGTWLTRFAIGYETFELSHSALQLGLVGFFSQAPTAIIAPLAGALVDRWDRHRTLILTQVLALLQSAALAAFALADAMTVWHLMALGAVQAVINAFDMPARQSFVRYMVDDRADVPNAIALNSSLVNGARLLGPTIAAALVAVVGVGWCFALDAISYLAVVASLLAMRVAKQPPRVRTSRVLDGRGVPAAGSAAEWLRGLVADMREGMRYVRGLPRVRSLLLLLAITSTFGGAYAALLPAVAEGSFGGNASALGVMMGAAGLGALVGVLYLAARERTDGLGTLIANCALALGVGLCALELAPSVWAALPVMLVVGGALIVQWSATNTLVQAQVDEAMLGRVMSLYAMAFFAGAPLGALAEGALASVLGPIHTFAIAGACCATAAWALRDNVASAD